MVVLIGCLIAFSAAYTVTIDSFDRISTAQDERADSSLDRQNTDIEIGVVNGSTASVTNAGSTVLSIEHTDLIVDGDYVADATPAFENGSTNASATDLWLPGETLVFDVDPSAERIKVVTENGVEATRTRGGGA